MKITWLGQAGLLFEDDKYKIMIDPYLSDSVEKVEPKNKRKVKVNPIFLQIQPDVLIFTHDHLDHYDPETAEHYLTRECAVTVLAPYSVWQKVRQYGGEHNYVMFNRHTIWSMGEWKFTAVKAEHSDAAAIGVILDNGKDKYYVTGDTLYNTDLFMDIPSDIKAVFLPVNGKGNNMNMQDAVRFCKAIGHPIAVPIHCGLFDEIDRNEFPYEPKVVPEFYKTVGLE